MPTVIETLAYTFDELSPEAQQKALDRERESACTDDWWVHTYDDAVTVGKLIGISINTRGGKGHDREWPDISFSGFSSQGDGLDYVGVLWVDMLKNAVVQVKTHVGEDEKMFALAARGEALYQKIVVRLMELRMRGIDVDDLDNKEDIDEVELFSRLNITRFSHRSYGVQVDDCPGTSEIVDAINSYVEDFASWIYSQLEAEHDYQTSDETLTENIQANELLFDEDGSII
jgi:hypothetical protein